MAVFVVDAVQYFLFCFIFYADGFSYFRMPFLVWDERYYNCDLNECAKTLNKKTTRQQTSFSITLHWWKFLGGRFIYYKMQWLIVPVLDQSDRSLAANLIETAQYETKIVNFSISKIQGNIVSYLQFKLWVFTHLNH